MDLPYCLITAIFIGASIYVNLAAVTCQPCIDYEKSLDSYQQSVYKKVVNERKKLYITGLVLGILFGFLYLFVIKDHSNKIKHSCVFLAIALGTQYAYYSLAPKRYSMLPILKNQDQVTKWWKTYKYMRNRYILGGLYGVAGYFLLCYFICNRNKSSVAPKHNLLIII